LKRRNPNDSTLTIFDSFSAPAHSPTRLLDLVLNAAFRGGFLTLPWHRLLGLPSFQGYVPAHCPEAEVLGFLISSVFLPVLYVTSIF